MGDDRPAQSAIIAQIEGIVPFHERIPSETETFVGLCAEATQFVEQLHAAYMEGDVETAYERLYDLQCATTELLRCFTFEFGAPSAKVPPPSPEFDPSQIDFDTLPKLSELQEDEQGDQSDDTDR